MTTFAQTILQYIQTERAAITTEQLITDFRLFKRTWEPEAANAIPNDTGMREAIAELEALGRIEASSEGWIFKPEKVKAPPRQLF